MDENELELVRRVLQEELPRVIREHPEVRYELRGMMLEAFPSRDEFNQLLEELRQHREETRAQFARVDERFGQVDAQFRHVDERFDRVETRLERVEQGQAKLEQGQAKLEQGQAELSLRVGNLEQGQLRLETRQTSLEQTVEELKRAMEQGFADVQKDLSRLGQRWGVWNEKFFRATIAAILEKSFGAKVESRVIQGEQFDLVISNGEHILVEIEASTGPNMQQRLERKRRLYIQETGITPARVLLATGSIHSRRAQALREAGFEVIEPEIEAED
ncbi:MAG: hypothetical protein B6D41_18720 [Chloroflexi bacterium UTCFX4]|jgi:hypothetical protein|nr:MAG: hypothetical protein B6D41_18720 [Chloroflexi bacterium UTCFX4]